MDEQIIVSNIVLGFGLSMLFFFYGQISRVFTEVIDTVIKR
jgi:hypothetical protein